MDDRTRERLQKMYEGPMGKFFDRVESARPMGYWEKNIVEGRRRVDQLLLQWMQPLAGKKILDIGCGRGALARQMLTHEAQVTATDILGRFPQPAHSEVPDGLNLLAEDGFLLAPAHGDFHSIVIREVLEDYLSVERFAALEYLFQSNAARVFLGVRMRGLWQGIARWARPETTPGTLDPIELLRWIHTHTSHRQTRTQTIRLRNYEVWLAELRRDPPPA